MQYFDFMFFKTTKWFHFILIVLFNYLGYWKCSESYRAESFHWQIGCALGLWWLSQLWVNNHIWLPKSERLAKVERLFVLPQYCGIMLEQSLMHNRRRNDLEDIPKTKKVKPDTTLDDSVSTAGRQYSKIPILLVDFTAYLADTDPCSENPFLYMKYRLRPKH